MDEEELVKKAVYFVENLEDNYITKEIAISEKVIGIKIFDSPIFAFGNSEDKYFQEFKDSTIVGENFILPKEWLPEAKTVISFFLPFTKEVKESNRKDRLWPSEEWLHGLIEGQKIIYKLCKYLKAELLNEGYNSIVPSLDDRFDIIKELTDSKLHIASSWSERHVAFACGHGTFGLSKGLITSKGMAGRFGSIITDLFLTPTKREYTYIYEYCSMCGACAKNCPANAISIEKGKDHILCSEYLNKISQKYKTGYGCGKCQVGVPCESKIANHHKI